MNANHLVDPPATNNLAVQIEYIVFQNVLFRRINGLYALQLLACIEPNGLRDWDLVL